MKNPDFAVFALNATKDFGGRVCAHLKIPLSGHEEREFEDGEHKTRPLISVRGKDVFVIHSLYGDANESVNDKLCRLIFFLGALRDASAGTITAVIPYLCYARKDRKSKPRDPVTTRYVAALFEAIGADRAVVLDVHNPAAFQNAWRVPTDHLEAKNLFVTHFAPLVPGGDVVVVSPDAGGVKRVEDFRVALARRLGREVQNAFIEKYRSAGVVSGHALVGDVAGKTAIILDDLISSGTTMARAAEACVSKGAVSVYVGATHGVFSSKANEALASAAISGIVVTNSVALPLTALGRIKDRLSVLDVSRLFASAIERIHSGGSVVELLES